MRFKDGDFNYMMPNYFKREKIEKGNKALEIAERIDQQIIHWSKLPDDNIFKKVVLDELLYLRDGKV